MHEVGGPKQLNHGRNRPPDHGIARLAERQHGVVAYPQLVGLGLRRGAIESRVSAGRLHRLHVGVYAVGHRRLSGHGRAMAAVLACGCGALLSHRSAADLWGIRFSSAGRFDVTAARTRAGRPGIALHRPRRLRPEDRDEKDGIPVTSVARTLVDLAAVLPQGQLRRAVEKSERLELFDLRAVEPLLVPGRPGVANLRAVLREYMPPPFTRSEAERRFLELCRAAGLPNPRVNTVVVGFEVDFTWHEARLVVELDSRMYHLTPAAFETDRARDAALQLAGYRVVRVTELRLGSEPEAVVQLLRALLSR
jgi:very-short-patch-repair endonuclease